MAKKKIVSEPDEFWEGGTFSKSISAADAEKMERTIHMRHDEEILFQEMRLHHFRAQQRLARQYVRPLFLHHLLSRYGKGSRHSKRRREKQRPLAVGVFRAACKKNRDN